MKSFLKLLSTLLFLAIVGLIWFFCVKFDGCGKKNIQKKEDKAKIEEANTITKIQYLVKHDTIVKYQDKDRIVHSVKTVIVGSSKEIDLFYKEKFDSISKKLGVSKDDISEVSNKSLSGNGEINGNIVQVGEGIFEVEHKDCFLNTLSMVDLNTMQDTLLYKANIHLSGVRYWQHKHTVLWFIHWGGISLKEDNWTNCPNVTIDSIEDIQVRKGR